MKKFLLILFSILFFLYSAPAQNEIKSDNWLLFDPLQEEFSIEFPPNVINKSFVDDKGNLISGFYTAHFNNTYFFVRSEIEKNNKFFDLLRNFILVNRATGSSHTTGNISVKTYKFTDEDGFFNKILEIKTKRRTYFFHTLSETENNSDTEKFFRSISLKEGVKIPKSALLEKAVPIEKTDTIKAPVKITNSGSGSGNGKGDTTGSALKADVPNSSSPLKISTKPRANYTDLAKYYEISGMVSLRVIFLANGNTGTITPVVKLPFGLTAQAIAAAKGIRFEPATRQGAPITVVKIIQYNFTLL